jgi:hypothetical protein
VLAKQRRLDESTGSDGERERVSADTTKAGVSQETRVVSTQVAQMSPFLSDRSRRSVANNVLRVDFLVLC